MGKSDILKLIIPMKSVANLTVEIDKVDLFEFELKEGDLEENNASVVLENANVAAIRSDNFDQSADRFDFTSGPEEPPSPDWGVPWHELTEFIREMLPEDQPGGLGDEMPEDLPPGLVVYEEFDLML
jgi:hypothetical protein